MKNNKPLKAMKITKPGGKKGKKIVNPVITKDGSMKVSKTPAVKPVFKKSAKRSKLMMGV